MAAGRHFEEARDSSYNFASHSSSPSASPRDSPETNQSGADPIFPVLAALDLDPQDLYASLGPTAPDPSIPADPRTSFPLPFAEPHRNRILHNAWLKIFKAVPSVQFLLPNLQRVSSSTVSPEQAVEFLAQHDYRLSTAQRVVVSPSDSSSAQAKGKRPAHALSASTSSSHLSSRASSPLTPDEHESGGQDALGPEYSEERRGMPCGHIFAKGEAIWRCRDCALDDTCVQCAPCFMASIHNRENHDVVFSVSSNSGGCCDCGDEEAWVKDVGCKYHSHQAQSDGEGNAEDMDADLEDSASPPDMPAEVLKALSAAGSQEHTTVLRNQLGDWFDFILTTLNHGPDDQKLYSRSFVRGAAYLAAQKVGALQSLDEWAAAIRGGNDQKQSKSSSSSQAPMSTVDPTRLPQPPGAYDFEQYFDLSPAKPRTPGEMWGTLPVDPSSPLPTQPSANRTGRKYALLLWNDEKHSLREVIDSVQDALSVTEAEGRDIADQVDQNGRHILAVSSDVSQLVGYVRRMNSIDLEVTIRPAFDVFCEELSHWLIWLIKDLAECNIYLPSATSGHASVLRLLVCSELLQEWSPRFRKPDAFSSPHMTFEYFDHRRICKLDGMLLMDQKLWKEARSLVRGWYMAIVARKEGRRTVAFRFAAMYPKIIETFILREREPEYSVVLITVQLFSVPSIGSDLVRHFDFLRKLLVILHSIYSGHLVPAQGTLSLPPDSPGSDRAQTESTLLRQMCCRHIFYDVRYLLQSDGVKEQIVSNTRHLKYSTDFLALFTAFLPEVRQRDHHIEFEINELWIAVFQVCQLLARQAKLTGEAFEKADAEQAVGAFTFALRETMSSCVKLHEKSPDVYSEYAQQIVRFDNTLYQINMFRVDREATAFHHPIHWFLAELTRRLSTLTQPELESVGMSHVHDLVSTADQSAFLFTLDFSLRVIVKITQVKLGMWVRNGSSTRGQASHYRDVAMRSSMYDQDLFLLQAGLALVQDQDRLLVSYMDRFRLRDYFNGRPRALEHGSIALDDAFDEDLERQFAEEFMLFLHYLVSEASSACAWSLEKVIRREIIHFLALNQGTYTALTRNIPDHMTEHPSFERLLSQVSNFRAPDGTSDLGIFELKDEFFEEVNPYFYHFSRNQRERAEEQLRAREKRAGRSPDDLVPVPGRSLCGESSRAFAASIARVFTSHVMRRILYYSIANNVENSGDADVPEALVDVSLQMLVVGIVEQEDEFIENTLAQVVQGRASEEEPNEPPRTIIGLLCTLEGQIKVKPLKAKVTWILDRAAASGSPLSSAILSASRRSARSAAQGAAFSKAKTGKQSLEAKRAAAKARQQAIMQKFSAQQKTLMETLDNEEQGKSGNDHVKREDDMDTDQAMGNGDTAMNIDEQTDEEPLGACIMCQEELKRDGSFGCLALVSQSSIIRTTPRNDVKAFRDVAEVPLTLDRVPDGTHSRTTKIYSGQGDEKYHPRSNLGAIGGGFSQADHKTGCVTSTCGHLLHVRCFEMYYRSIEQRHSSQVARNHAEDSSRYEFVCPLCKSLGNVILPVPDARTKKPVAGSRAGGDTKAIGQQELDETPMGDWLRKINIDILKTSGTQSCSLFQETTTGTGCFVHWYADSALSTVKDNVSVALPDNVDEPTLAMLVRLTAALRPVATSTRSARMAWQSRTILAPVNRKMYLPEELVAYTLSTMEVSQRGQASRNADGAASNVAMALANKDIGLLKSLIFCLKGISAVEATNMPGKTPLARTQCSSAMRQGLLKRLLPHWSTDELVRYPLLLRDPLTILIEAAIIAPEYLSQVTTLMYYATLVQTVFGLAQPSVWPQSHGPSPASRGFAHVGNQRLTPEEKVALKHVFPDVRWTVGNIVNFVGYARGNISLGTDNLDDDTLGKMLCTYTLPFLRRAAILRRAVCGDQTFRHASWQAQQRSEEQPIEYLRLLSDLQIPPPAQALPIRAERQSPISGVIEGWVKHAYAPMASLFRPLPINTTNLAGSNAMSGAIGGLTQSSGRATPSSNSTSGAAAGTNQGGLAYLQSNQSHQILQLEHPHIYELVALPHDLTVLLQYSQRNVCKRCNQVPPDPALCLFCGELVCYQSFCCMDTESGRGECNRHVTECGGNVGLFFKLKANVIFILYYSKGTFTFSPYLDSHGEVDVGLQKGRPQRLHRQRADELRRMWLTGGLATMVARKIEASMDAGGWNTT